MLNENCPTIHGVSNHGPTTHGVSDHSLNDSISCIDDWVCVKLGDGSKPSQGYDSIQDDGSEILTRSTNDIITFFWKNCTSMGALILLL